MIDARMQLKNEWLTEVEQVTEKDKRRDRKMKHRKIFAACSFIDSCLVPREFLIRVLPE